MVALNPLTQLERLLYDRMATQPALAQGRQLGELFDELALTLQTSAFKEPVRLATTGNDPLAGVGGAIDGVPINAGDRILVRQQADPIENGIYIVSSGQWQRATDADTDEKLVAGSVVFVEEGASNADTAWLLTTDNPITVGVTPIIFEQFPPTALTFFAATATGDINTTAQNFTTIADQQIAAPGAGTYLVWHSSEVFASAAGVDVEVNLSLDNVEVAGARRVCTHTTRTPLSIIFPVVVPGTEDIRVRWRRQPNGGPPPTITMGNRMLMALKVA